MQVVADVDEADIAGVKDSARVTFTVDAYPDDVFEAEFIKFVWEVQTVPQAAAPQPAAKLLSHMKSSSQQTIRI